MKRLLTLSALVLGLVLQAENAPASAFKVTPVRIAFSRPSSTLLTLRNESDQVLRFQITSFAWSQEANGEMNLTPTEDITFFPALLTLKPAEERKVRIAARVAAADVEKTYRIFFEELPPLEKGTDESGVAQIRILTKMGIPIFVSPAKGQAEANIEGETFENGTLRFDVRNSGNVHFALQGVMVKGVTAEGETVFERQMDGWYVLARSPRSYQTEIPNEACRKIRAIVIEAQTGITNAGNVGVVTKRMDLPAAACK